MLLGFSDAFVINTPLDTDLLNKIHNNLICLLKWEVSMFLTMKWEIQI